MGISAVRSAMMTRLDDISGVAVPEPVPAQLDDKTIVVYPGSGSTTPAAHRGTNGKPMVRADDTMIVEYHRRVPQAVSGSVIGDIAAMEDTIRDLVWGEVVPQGGKFGDTIEKITSVETTTFGPLGWNEYTCGCRLAIAFTHTFAVGG